MSAICGVVNFDGAPADLALLRRMTAAAPWRGPDGVRHWVEGNAGLAHQAFHVTPESVRERQPLTSADGRLVLVADARLDNRDDLIRALRGDELPPEPTDADLILAAYRRWTEKCPERLLGDFAFAIWDEAGQELLLVRDPLGARGLYYHVDGRRVLFASEVGQMLDLPGVSRRIDADGVADYMAALHHDHEATLFESIRGCPPAHAITVKAGGVQRRRYWDVNPEASIRYRDDREYAEHFLEIVTAATRCRMRSIGPVGLSLSGGLDSTLIAAVAADLLPAANLPQARLKTFSSVFDELKECDERGYIWPVVERLGLDATYLPGDDKWPLKDLPRWPVERDYIWADPYAGLTGGVAMAARDGGCRVLLDGHFGDVLFVGGAYWAADIARDGRWKDLRDTIVGSAGQVRWRRDLLDHGLRQLVPSGFRRAFRRLKPRPYFQDSRSLHPDLARRAWRRARDADCDRARMFTAPGQWVRFTAMTDSSWSSGSSESQRYYNRHVLEAASPYQDRRLVEYAMALPGDQLGRPGRSRWMQRNAMTDLLPDAVRERSRKTVFQALLTRGLFDRENAAMRGILAEGRCVEQRFVSPEWLKRALADRSFALNNSHQLWLIIGLELWLSAQSDEAASSRPAQAWKKST